MGKRELLIASAFVVVAVLAYQLTAPPPKAGERGFSLGRIFSNIKREISANSASATVTKDGVVALRAGVTEIRLAASRSVPLTIVGERRDDVAYEMSVEATGPDEATAKANANGTVLKDDDLGVAERLELKFTEGGQHTARLTLRVPKNLLIRIEGSGRVTASDVRAVDLRNLAGDVTLTNIVERLSGSHRNGELTVTHAGSVDLALSSSRARLTQIEGAMTLNARSGECTVTKSRGTLEAVMANVDFSVVDQDGAVHVSGELGTLKVTSPTRELAVDVRRMEVEVTITAAIPATVITSNEDLQLTIGGSVGLTIDAAATDGGTIRAADLGVEPTHADRESRLTAPVGGGGPRVVLRNSNADIVIGPRK